MSKQLTLPLKPVHQPRASRTGEQMPLQLSNSNWIEEAVARYEKKKQQSTKPGKS